MPSGSIHGFFKRFRAGDPVAAVSNIQENNLIKNFIEGLVGCGCRLEKPTENGLLSCRIIVDGSSDRAAGETPQMAEGRIRSHRRNLLGSPAAWQVYGSDGSAVEGWQDCIVLGSS